MRALILAACLATPAAAEDAFQWVAEPGFQDAGAAHQGVVALKQGDFWGLMGRDGQWVAAPQFQAVGDPGKGWFPVEKAGKWGVVDLTGAEMAGFDYDAIGKPADFTPFKYQGQWFVLNQKGDFLAEPLPFDTLLANDGTCITGTRNGSFVSYSGADYLNGGAPFLQTLPEVQDALPPSEGFVAVKLPGGWVQLNCADGAMVVGDDAPFAAMRPVSDGQMIEPLHAHGVTVMSLGLMMKEGEAVVWRGPMLMGALQQMLNQVNWGELDILLVDLPPGTGDVQLSLCQKAQVSGAIIVSTPQDVALIDARRAIDMFDKLKTPVLGLVENMSTYICPNCGHEAHLFGHGGVAAEAQQLGLPFLGEIPLNLDVRLAGDNGTPIAAGDSPVAEAFTRLAKRLIDGGMA